MVPFYHIPAAAGSRTRPDLGTQGWIAGLRRITLAGEEEGFMADRRHQALIAHQDDIGGYVPPDHRGTVNIRLVDGSFCGAFEMNLGTVQPGGEAEPHFHETEHQVFYVLEGRCEVSLGDDPPVTCGPGTVVRIPPKLLHRVVAVGDDPMRGIVLYSPPLGPRNEVPVDPD